VGDGGDLSGSSTSAFGRYRLRWGGRYEGRAWHRVRDFLKRRKRNVSRWSLVKVRVLVRVQAMVDNAAKWIR